MIDSARGAHFADPADEYQEAYVQLLMEHISANSTKRIHGRRIRINELIAKMPPYYADTLLGRLRDKKDQLGRHHRLELAKPARLQIERDLASRGAGLDRATAPTQRSLGSPASSPAALIRHPSPPQIPLIQGVNRDKANFLERKAWLQVASHSYLARRLINRYMDATGTTYTLSQEEMIHLRAKPLNLWMAGEKFSGPLRALRKESLAGGKKSKAISVKHPSGANVTATLGNFTVYYTGVLTITGLAQTEWEFRGVMTYFDVYDFDAKAGSSNSNRPWHAEARVQAANVLLPGRPFRVLSVRLPVYQNNSMKSVRIRKLPQATRDASSYPWLREQPTKSEPGPGPEPEPGLSDTGSAADAEVGTYEEAESPS